jgi:UrcA family protein
MTIPVSSQPRPYQVVATAALAGLLLSLGSAAIARAAGPEEVVPSITIRYDDLDLATEQGTHGLYRRIVEAARKVCEPHDADALGRLAVRYCRQQTISRAVQLVGNPRLAALHAAARSEHRPGHHSRLVSAAPTTSPREPQ